MKNILKAIDKNNNTFHVILGDVKYSYTNNVDSFLGYLQSKAKNRTEYGNATRQDRFFYSTRNLEVFFIATNIKDEDALNIKKEIIGRDGKCDSQFTSKL